MDSMDMEKRYDTQRLEYDIDVRKTPHGDVDRTHVGDVIGEYFFVNLKSSLANLKVNDKKLIKNITSIAGIGYDKANEVVRIIMNNDSAEGLLKLYVIDSIIKQIGGNYLTLFSDELLNPFRKVFLNADNGCRSKLFELRTTWKNLVDEAILNDLDRSINRIDSHWPLNNAKKSELDDERVEEVVTKPYSRYGEKLQNYMEDSEEDDFEVETTNRSTAGNSMNRDASQVVIKKKQSLSVLGSRAVNANSEIANVMVDQRIIDPTMDGSQGAIKKKQSLSVLGSRAVNANSEIANVMVDQRIIDPTMDGSQGAIKKKQSLSVLGSRAVNANSEIANVMVDQRIIDPTMDGSQGAIKKKQSLSVLGSRAVNANSEIANVMVDQRIIDPTMDGSQGAIKKKQSLSVLGSRAVRQIVQKSPQDLQQISTTMIVKSFIFDQIEQNKKTVEVRIYSSQFYTLQAGDLIKFLCGSKSTIRRITGTNRYANFEDLLYKEGLQKCLPDVGSMAEALTFYRTLPNYHMMEITHGVLALRLEPISFNGSKVIIRNTQTEGIVNMSQLEPTTKFAIPLDVNNNKGKFKFAVELLEKHRKYDFDEIGRRYKVPTPQNDNYGLWDEIEFPSTQQLIENAIVPNPNTDLWEDDIELPSTQQLMKTAIVPTPHKPHKRTIDWIATNHTYQMSDEVFNQVYNLELGTVNHHQFLYRKDSIGNELDKIFPGCNIYVDKVSPCKKYWKLRAYCNHTGCRRYCLTASHMDPKNFVIEIDKMEICHEGTLTKQLRRYERDQRMEKLKNALPQIVRNDDLMTVDTESRIAGNYQTAKSLCVYQKARTKALQMQDNCTDDVDDVTAMWTDDPKTNFVSHMLPKNNFAVYITSKRQHDVLHLLHVLRPIYGIQIVGRTDASGNIARDIENESPMYYALTVNIRIQSDKNTTPLALAEQFNIRNQSKDIARWFFDFVLSHASFYEDHPLLLDWMITDFSYANFHSILKAFNMISLKRYLNLARKWILYKQENGEFPDEFYEMVKIKMCYTHLMNTFALMTKRLYGKNKNHQLPQSRIILEILATMIQTTDYSLLKKCWEQLTILLLNKYVTDDVEKALLEINHIKVADINLETYSEELLETAVDFEMLPEYDATLYKSNLFYKEFAEISDNIKIYEYNNTQQKNVYYNTEFFQKFLVRFVPLIPMWTRILQYKSYATSDEPPPISLLEADHNQPIENYFGYYKSQMQYNTKTIGKLPVKIGRAITFSQEIMTPTIQSVNLCIPKERLNSKKPRKQYVRKKGTSNPLPREEVSTKDPAQRQATDENEIATIQEEEQVEEATAIDTAQRQATDENEIDTVQEEQAKALEQRQAPHEDEIAVPKRTAAKIFPKRSQRTAAKIIQQSVHQKPTTDEEDEEIDVIGTQSNLGKPTVTKKSIRQTRQTPAEKLIDKKAIKKTVRKKSHQYEDTITFGESKEAFNKKRPVKPFTYFQGKQLTKLINKKELETHNDIKSQKVLKNGLWKNVNFYRHLDIEFVVCKKRGLLLTNKDFDTITSKGPIPIPESLMIYLLVTVPQQIKVMVSKNGLVDWHFKLERKIKLEIITIRTENGWVLLVINHSLKSFGFVNEHLLSNQLDQTFRSTLEVNNYTDMNVHALSFNDNGIYIYKQIQQYQTPGHRIPVKDSHLEEYPLELQNKLINDSDNMTDNCTICGSDDITHIMVECTSCKKWLHCSCINVIPAEVEKNENFECPICLRLTQLSSLSINF